MNNILGGGVGYNTNSSQRIKVLEQNNLIVMEYRIKNIQAPAGYFEYQYEVPEIEGYNIISKIPVLWSYEFAGQQPAFAYTGRQFWIESSKAGFINFIMYAIYKPMEDKLL